MTFAIGETVGRYRIVEQRGQGGMATVFSAYDAALDRYVAIKVMHQAFKEDRTFLARFQREAQIVAKLRHPHIVAIHEYAEHNNQSYLVMEFVEGETLKGRLNKAPLSLNETVELMLSVGDALAYAHDQGVLHRDIKPSNILLDKTGKPYLTDFGLARMVQAGESTLSQDMLLGTPQYISPEQARGERDLGAPTDIYSLGIVLYLLVVGRVPFNADTPYAIVHDHIYTPLPMPSVINPSVPPEIERVLLKALAKEPEDRYQSARDLASAFAQSIESSQIQELSPQSVIKANIPAAKAQPDSHQVAAGPIPAAAQSEALYNSQIAALESKARRRRSLWMLGGLGSFICICLLSLFVAVAALTDPTFQNVNTIDGLAEEFGEPMPMDRNLPPLRDLLNASTEEIRTIARENPNSPVAHFALGLSLLNEREIINGQNELRDAILLSERQPEFLYEAIEVITEEGYEAEMLVALLQAAQQTDSPFVRDTAGRLMYEYALGAESNARRIVLLQRLAENNADSAAMIGVYARALTARGQFELARLRFEEAFAIEEISPELLLLFGDWHAAQGDIEPAIDIWDQARSTPDAPPWVIEIASTQIVDVTGN